jgi:hypothetical protein
MNYEDYASEVAKVIESVGGAVIDHRRHHPDDRRRPVAQERGSAVIVGSGSCRASSLEVELDAAWPLNGRRSSRQTAT